MPQSTLHLDERANGTECRLTVGETVEIALAENPTTGFRWHLVEDARTVMILADDRFDTRGAMPGQGGVRRFTFEAVRPGRAELTAVYRRSWEPDTASQPTFSMTVVVDRKP